MKNIFIGFFAFVVSFAAQAGVVNGIVSDENGKGIAGVAVSDGVNIVMTNADGFYSIDTNKKHGLVFVSTPSGYEPTVYHANRPKFWQMTTTPIEEDECINFRLHSKDDSRYAFITMADNQITNRPGEVKCFRETSLPDINATITDLRNEGIEPFVIMLGDQAHDCYWEKNRYSLSEAYADLESINAPIYSVMGNHDQDPTAMNDHDAALPWRRVVGPTYYSFNKGGAHFIMLDNIELTENSPQLSSDGECVYTCKIVAEQMEWLKKDLTLVKDKSAPLVIAMHAPLYSRPGSKKPYAIENGEELIDALKDFENVNIISGHTHVSYKTDSPDGKIHDINYGAVCGSWWLNARVALGNDNNICRDGTPSGYGIWQYSDGKFSNIYKGTGYDTNFQFRTYDLNMIEFENEELSKDYLPGREKNNEILVNVWGYGPGWTVEVFENGKPLSVEQITTKDPMFILSCPVPYLALGKKLIGTVRPVNTAHMFKAKAKADNSSVEIRVTDNEGRVFTQFMERPKALTVEN